jgi:integrating conjugative element membrane protein (TIGR03747 family)
MSTQQRSNARPVQQQQKGPLLFLISLAGGFAFSVFTALLVSMILAWIGMHWWWKDEGIHHSRNLVMQDLNFLKDYDRSLVTNETASEFAAGWAAVTAMAADKIGFTRLIKAGADPIPATATDSQRRIRNILKSIAIYLLAAFFVLQDIAVRLAIIYLALPALVLAVVLGTVDGLARRDIRKWSGGRESSFLYHHSKRLLWPAFTGGFFLYLSWPIGGVNPAWVVLPFCVAMGLMISLMAATFKKYL